MNVFNLHLNFLHFEQFGASSNTISTMRNKFFAMFYNAGAWDTLSKIKKKWGISHHCGSLATSAVDLSAVNSVRVLPKSNTPIVSPCCDTKSGVDIGVSKLCGCLTHAHAGLRMQLLQTVS